MFAQFLSRLRAHWTSWVGLVSGILSILLTVRATVLTMNLEAALFWVGAYVCGTLAFVLVGWTQWRNLKNLKTPKVAFCDEVDAGVWEQHYRVLVKNVAGVTAKHIGLRLIRIEPDVPSLALWLNLHCMGVDRPNSALVDLNPGPPAKFDLFRIGRKQPGELDIAGETYEPVIPMQRYRVTLCLHGKDMPSQEKDFIFEPKGDGAFAFYTAPPTDNAPAVFSSTHSYDTPGSRGG